MSQLQGVDLSIMKAKILFMVVQLVEYVPPKLIGWVLFLVRSCSRLVKQYLTVQPWHRWVGAREQFTQGDAIDSPSVQHSLRKQPHGPWPK